MWNLSHGHSWTMTCSRKHSGIRSMFNKKKKKPKVRQHLERKMVVFCNLYHCTMPLTVVGRQCGSAPAEILYGLTTCVWSAHISRAGAATAAAAADHPCQTRLRLQSVAPLPLQLLLVLQQSHQLFGLLSDIDTLVTSVSIQVLEVFQRLNGEYVLFCRFGHTLGARFHKIVQQRERLVNVTPVFAVIVQPLPDNSHHLGEGHHVVGQVRDLGHERAGRSPVVVGRGLSHFNLGLGEVVHHVFHLAADRRALHVGGWVFTRSKKKIRPGLHPGRGRLFSSAGKNIYIYKYY